MEYKRRDKRSKDNITVACHQWTQEELTKLVCLQKQFGSNWSFLSANYFPGRNANQLKCKFNYLAHRRKLNLDKEVSDVLAMLGFAAK